MLMMARLWEVLIGVRVVHVRDAPYLSRAVAPEVIEQSGATTASDIWCVQSWSLTSSTLIPYAGVLAV